MYTLCKHLQILLMVVQPVKKQLILVVQGGSVIFSIYDIFAIFKLEKKFKEINHFFMFSVRVECAVP